MDNKGRWVAVWIGLFLVISVVGGFLIKGIIDNALYNRFPDRGVPRINIDLNGVSLDEIKSGSKETKYEGNDLQIYNGGEILEYGGVEIKGRGNGTWAQEKKPFQIKFENKVDMFGMGEARKWYLLANNADPTHIRNEIAFNLEKMLGMKYAFSGEFVELYFNEEYEGLYYLTNAIEISKNSINLNDSMGILIELDNIYGPLEENYITSNGDVLIIKDNVNDYDREESMMSFLRLYNELEDAIPKKDYERIKEIIDVESWVDYYLLSEFSVNPDAYWTSFYFYKDGAKDKIHAGPGWDFDLAFGNRNWGVYWMGDRFYSPEETMIRKQELLLREEYKKELEEGAYDWSGLLSRVMFNLMEISNFDEAVKTEYQSRLSGRGDEIIIKIKKIANKISDAAQINNAKWKKNDFWNEVNQLIDWTKKRYEFFEKTYGKNMDVYSVF